MNDKLNRGRYVHVSDLRLGEKTSYADFEELAFSDLDDVAEVVTEVIAGMTEFSGNYQISGPHKDEQGEWVSAVWTEDYPNRQNIRDILFYNVIHVVSAWNDCDIPWDREKIETIVDSSRHLLEDVLTCGWVMRQDPE